MVLHYLRRTVSIALLLLLIGAGAGLVVFQAGGGKLMSVQSGSMEPSINKGGLVAVKSIPTEEIREGDIITYINPADRSQTITHRVTGSMPSIMSGGKPYFITKGDANSAADRPVQASAVVGKVSFHVPYAGHMIDFMRQPLGLLLIAYIPALIIIIYEIRRLAAYYRQIRPYQLRPGRRVETTQLPLALFAGAMIILSVVAGTATTAFAALQSQATLTGNTISSVPLVVEPEEPVDDDKDIECTNNTDVDIDQTTNQQASSGDASVRGNTNGGSATSGNVSNSNSSSFNIEINNGSCAVKEQQ